MPSQLATRRDVRRERRKVAATLRAQQTPMQTITEGYVPDVNEDVFGFQAARTMQGLIAEGAIIRNDDGWSQLDSARLPLGDDAAGAAAAPATAGIPQPIVGLGRIFRRDTRVIEHIAITGDTGTNGSETGHVFEIGTTGAWTAVAFGGSGSDIGENGSAGSVRRNLFDFAPYPPGGTAGQLVFTNYDGATGEEVFRYDPNAGDYDVLFNNGDPQEPFLARSVELVDGRLVFLNVSESGAAFPQGVRWTDIGSGTPRLDRNAFPGAGSMLLTEFQEPGLRILRMGDVLACYFGDGVAFLRRLGLFNAPFSRVSISHLRGLLAPFAVTPIGRDIHFGIFTDGWYLLSASSGWKEVGVSEVAGKRAPKWKRTFYSELSRDPDIVGKMVVEFQEEIGVVRVAWPSQGANENDRVWTFDIDGDRVFPDPYPVTYWGSFDRRTDAATIYNDFNGVTYNSFIGTDYDDWRARERSRQIGHGTEGGFVYLHRRDIATRDDQPISVLLDTHRSSFVSPGNFQTASRIRVPYRNVNGSPLVIQAVGAEEEVAGQTKSTVEGPVNSLQTVYADMHLSSTHHGIRISGTAPVELLGYKLEWLPDEGGAMEDV